MCGISGYIKTTTLTDTDRQRARQMNQCLVHRGPDSDGWYEAAPNLLLGMRRLSIIDVAGGAQPLYNEDKSVVVLFNGEIYNFVELRRDLEQRGHTFRTHGDGETICHLYEEHGIAGLNQLRGMYAIALYDSKQQQFFLLRDRMGEKPLYYTLYDDAFLYASEFKALADVLGPAKLALRPEAIDLFLHYQFVPEPMTMVQNVTKLPAGYYLQLDLGTLQYSVQKYWDLVDSPAVTSANPKALVRQELLYIADIIGRSDVPVGIALSGGLDSSTVAALVKQHNTNKDITHAFTIGYAGRPPYDEREKAKYLTDKLGIHLHEVELTTQDFVTHFPTLVRQMDDPIADIAAFSIYSVMEAAHKEGIKVMLNGIGADELFWGYQWIADAVEESKRRRAAGQAEAFAFYDVNADFQFADYQKHRVFTPAYRAQLPADYLHNFYHLPAVQPPHIQMIDVLSRTWLFSNPIALGDRMSMAHSIELRSPFLDYKLVELAIGLNKTQPDLYKQPTKQLLKDAVADSLPPEVLQRPKQGFRPPVEDWMAAVIKRYGHLLTGGYLVEHGIITRRAALLATHANNYWLRRVLVLDARYVFYVYKLLVVEIWCRQFLRAESIK